MGVFGELHLINKEFNHRHKQKHPGKACYCTYNNISKFFHMSILSNFGGIQLRSNHQCPIGHLALSNVVFNFIKHPHCMHLADLLLKNGHSLHFDRRNSINSLSDLGSVGSNRSKNVTSLAGSLTNLSPHYM